MAVKVEQDLTGLVWLIHRSQIVGQLMHAIGEHFIRQIHKNFEVGGRPHKWIPSKRVLKMKHGELKVEKEGKTLPKKLQGKTLIKTGKLYESIAYKGTAKGGEIEVVAGTNKEYGIYHQYGVPARHIPARPFLVIVPELEEKIRKTVEEWLEYKGK